MIGVFDSGIGGLTVVKQIKRILPQYDLIYFGDTARVPYGNKSEALIKQYALQDAKFLIKHGAKVIVVACNTVSAVALEKLRSDLAVPFFGVIEPAWQAAVAATVSGRIGVIGTRATINSNVFLKQLKAMKNDSPIEVNSALNEPAFLRKNRALPKKLKFKLKLFSQTAPLLVPLIEENYFNKPETVKILKQYLYPLKQAQIDTLILGCTHYPIIYDLIAKKMKQVRIIDSAASVARQLSDYLDTNQDLARSLSRRGQTRFFVSDLTPHLNIVARNFMGKSINLESTETEF